MPVACFTQGGVRSWVVILIWNFVETDVFLMLLVLCHIRGTTREKVLIQLRLLPGVGKEMGYNLSQGPAGAIHESVAFTNLDFSRALPAIG